MKKSNVEHLVQDFHTQLFRKLVEVFKKTVNEAHSNGSARHGKWIGIATRSCYTSLADEFSSFIPTIERSLLNIPNRTAKKDYDFLLEEHIKFIKGRCSNWLIAQVKQDFQWLRSRDRDEKGLKDSVDRELSVYLATVKSKITSLKEGISNRESPWWNKKYVRATVWTLKWSIPVVVPALAAWLGLSLFKNPSKPSAATQSSSSPHSSSSFAH